MFRLLLARSHLGITGFRSPEALAERFFREALDLRAFLPAVGPCLDIGSGGGTPALPLAAAAGTGDWVLVEARRLPCEFLREAVETMGLASRVRVHRGRFEDYLKQDEAPSVLGAVSAVTLRAVRLNEAEWRGLADRLSPSAVVLWPTSRAARGRSDLPDGLFEETEQAADRGIVWLGRPRRGRSGAGRTGDVSRETSAGGRRRPPIAEDRR